MIFLEGRILNCEVQKFEHNRFYKRLHPQGTKNFPESSSQWILKFLATFPIPRTDTIEHRFSVIFFHNGFCHIPQFVRGEPKKSLCPGPTV